ncbi:MAG: hypothetical protein V4760_14610 [Bdellovibrionota bacterium]
MRALVFVALFGGLVACGPAPSVELSQPPVAPKPEPAKPSTPATDPSAPGDGTVTAEPTPTPAPALPRLRVVCIDTLMGSLHMLSGSARPSDGVPRLQVRLENAPVGQDNVIDSANPVPVESGVRDQLDVLYEGAQELGIMQPGPRRVLLAKVDMPVRQGLAKDLAPAAVLSFDVREAARLFGVQARNFGVSDQGSFLIVPRGKTLEIVSHKTLQKLAIVALDPARTVMPQIFEAESLLTALVFEKGVFKVVALKISNQAGPMTVSTPSSFAPSTGATYSSPSWLKAGSLVWTESQTKSTPGALAFVTYDVTAASITRTRFAALANEHLSPQMAVIRARTSPLVAVVAEVSGPHAPGPTGGQTRQLVSGRMIYLELSKSGGAPREVASFDYPSYVIRSTQSYGIDGAFAIQRIMAPTGAREALLSLDTGATGEMIFKERGGALDGVGGLSCTNPNVIEEVP